MRIDLEGLSGFEFEGVCAAVLRGLGYDVEESTASADYGRDLILTGPDGERTVVECKLQASAVGRPVIQKLHSAALTAHAQRAMLISIGGFSNQAVQYARSLSDMKIELVDRAGFEALAARAGFGQDGTHAGVLLAVAPAPLLEKRLKQFFLSRLTCNPPILDRAVVVMDRKAVPQPVIRVRYSIHKEFSTSAGLIHQIDIQDGSSVLDSRSCMPLDAQQQRVIEMAYSVGELTTASAAAAGTSPEPWMDARSLADAWKSAPLNLHAVRLDVQAILCETHTKMVVYQGRNGVTYSRECAPSPRDIRILSIEPLVVPYQIVTVGLHGARFTFSVLDSALHSHLLEQDVTSCTACQGRDGRMQACVQCGIVSHLHRLFGRCGFRCHACSRTICRRCVLKTPFLLFFARFWCANCLRLQPESARRVASHLATPTDDPRLGSRP